MMDSVVFVGDAGMYGGGAPTWCIVRSSRRALNLISGSRCGINAKIQ